MSADCPLCAPTLTLPRVAGEGREGEATLWRDAQLRVILASDPDHPGFCRVVWNAHVREMTDLAAADRAHLMAVVYAVEQALRDMLAPAKMNIASLGNQVPHLHWHVIPRFKDDAHFPNPIWSPRAREGVKHGVDRAVLAAKLSATLSRK